MSRIPELHSGEEQATGIRGLASICDGARHLISKNEISPYGITRLGRVNSGSEMQPTRSSDENIKTLGKVRRVLECFSTRRRSLSLAEICDETGYPKSTTHRLVSSMRDIGFLDQDRERDRYRLGLKLFEFGSVALANLELHREALPEIELLRQTTGHSVHLAVFDGHQAVVIHRSESLSNTSTPVHLIENAPIHCTSVGKAILAFQGADIIEKIVAAGLAKYTDATLVAEEPLLNDLKKTGARGYAVDDCEHRPGLRCVGAPIHDQFGIVSASVSVSAPAWQIPLDEVEQLSKIVIHHANNISALIGYVPNTRLTRSKANS